MNNNITADELRQVDLNLMLVLSLMVRERSVQQVARHLRVGSPAVSMALRRLRSLFQDALFVRTAREMVPTPRAHALATAFNPFLERIRHELQPPGPFDPASVRRSLRLGIADDLEAVLLPALLGKLVQLAPQITLRVGDGDYQTVDRSLQAGDAEVMVTAIMAGHPINEPHKILYQDDFVALYDPRRIKDCASMDAYLSHPHLLISARGDPAGVIEAPLKAAGHHRRIVATLARFTTLPQVLERVAAICNVPRTIGNRLATDFDLALQELPMTSPRFEVAVAWQRALDQDPFTRWFVTLIEATLDELRRPPLVEPHAAGP